MTQAIPQPLRGSSLGTREPFLAETPNRPPNSKRRLSAQARGSLQLPRNAQPVPSKGKGEMPKRGTPLGCSLVLSRSEKEQAPYPRCGKCAVTRNPQSCFIATQPTPLKLLPLSPQGTPFAPVGKLKTPKRYRKTNGCEPSQSPAVTALPEGEPRGRADLRLRGACGRQSLSPYGAAPFTQGSLFSAETPNRQPNSKRRLSAQARGSLQLPRNARPVPTQGKGEMPKRGTPLGCSLVLSRSEKEQEPCSAPRKSCRQLQSTILS